jgi:pilus assembly protein TadC
MTPVGWIALGVGVLLAGRPRPLARHRGGPAKAKRPANLAVFAGGAAALAVLLLGGSHSVILAPMAAIAAALMVRTLDRRATSATPDERSLAFALDLVSSVLAGGAPPETALSSVAEAAQASGSAPLAAAMAPLYRVGRLLELGADPAAVWAGLDELPGYRQVAAAGRRCAESGAQLSGALAAVALDLRHQRHAHALSRAERVGVWTLLPLGLCFLPAFVCLGVVPVVAGVAGQVLSGV